MRRVVVTGMGIVSCLGNSKEAVTASLREGRSGIRFIPEYAEMGFRSHVAGRPDVDFAAEIDRMYQAGGGRALDHVETHPAVCAAFRPKSAIRPPAQPR